MKVTLGGNVSWRMFGQQAQDGSRAKSRLRKEGECEVVEERGNIFHSLVLRNRGKVSEVSSY